MVPVQVMYGISYHINPKLFVRASVRPCVTLSSRSRTSYGSATGTSRYSSVLMIPTTSTVPVLVLFPSHTSPLVTRTVSYQDVLVRVRVLSDGWYSYSYSYSIVRGMAIWEAGLSRVWGMGADWEFLILSGKSTPSLKAIRNISELLQ